MTEIEPTHEDIFEKVFYVKDGIIHFKDADSYVGIIDRLRNISVSDRLKFSKENNYISFFQMYQDKLEKLDTNNKEEYKKYITIVDGMPEINFITTAMATIANQDGLLYVGNQLLRFVDDKEIIVKDGIVSKAMNWQKYMNKEVIVLNTHMVAPEVTNSKARASASLCRRIAGQTGGFSIFQDGARVETKIRRSAVPIGELDMCRMYFYGKSTGTYVNTSWFGSKSVNNTLTSAYVFDTYDWNNNITATKQVYNVSTNTGSDISYEDSGVYAGSCYSFQLYYYYANLRQVGVPPYPGASCSIANCSYMFTKYQNDKFQVSADCTSDTSN